MIDRKTVSRELKRSLVANGLGHLRVRSGTGTASGWLEVYAHDIGSFFTEAEKGKLRRLFGPVGTNFVYMTREEWAMKLGLIPKQPICSMCGTTWETEEGAHECTTSH